MAGRLILGTANPSVDGNGEPVSGSTLTFYQNKTTTLQSIYSSVSLATPLPNPLSCDASGEFPQVWVPSYTAYSVKWSRPGEADVTFDDIYASAGPSPVSTTTVLQSGTTATYTVPTANGVVRQLKIRMIGGGAGGSGTNNTTHNAGTVPGITGQNTVFNGVVAQGGNPGSGFNSGGPTTGGTGTANFRIQGPGGGQGFDDNAVGQPGGSGGSGPFGGAGQGGSFNGGAGAGLNATGFTGAGGGGAFNVTTGHSGPGGGCGEYVELIINAPAPSYIYTVAQSVLGGATTQNGGSGSGGVIIIEEIY